MMAFLVFLFAVCILTIVTDLLLFFFWQPEGAGKQSVSLAAWPAVSVLVAARNEEQNIERCLRSLLRLDYPPEKLEILVGDDDSGDDTLQLAAAVAAEHPEVKVFSIRENLGNARGKANVLAHLARHAGGDIYFITDADIAVPPSWIKGMLTGHTPVGIVSGVTGVEGNPLQRIEWLFAMGMLKVITDFNCPVTAVGNNMYVTREAYEAVGGYETIPFSVTEDFELFRQVRKKGFVVLQLYNKDVLAESLPARGFLPLLIQRKRWMHGAVQLPWPVVGILSLQAFYYLALIALLILTPAYALLAFAIKTCVQTAFILRVHRTLGQKVNYAALVIYEFYSMILSLSSGVFYLLPVKIIWKDRKY